MTFGTKYPAISREIHEKSFLTAGDFARFEDGVFAIYDELANGLPECGWKRGKPAHARTAFAEVQKFARVLGLTRLMIPYVALACAAHDLGRMVQAFMRERAKGNLPNGVPAHLLEKYPSLRDDREGPPYDDNDQLHGYESVLLLQPILGGFVDTEPGRWLLTSILHHSLKDNPTLEMCDGSEEALGLCGVVRDIDRVVAFNHDVDSYLYDEDRKLRERRQNFSGGSPEMGRIYPVEFLMETPLIQAIDRQKCLTYETYMLQFLKWLFNFMREDMQDMAIAGGGPQKIATYLLKQLETMPDQRAHLLAQLEAWRGGILLR
jgi:hypothetical protein